MRSVVEMRMIEHETVKLDGKKYSGAVTKVHLMSAFAKPITPTCIAPADCNIQFALGDWC